MKKILYVVGSFQYGGTEAFILDSYKNINKKNKEFDLYIGNQYGSESISKEYIKRVEKQGIKVYYGETLTSKLKFMQSFYNHLKNNGPYNVVHSNINLMNSWIMFISFIVGVKTRISHSHATSNGENISLSKSVYFSILKLMVNVFSTDILASSEKAGIFLYGEKKFKKQGLIIKNRIDVEKFQNIDPNLNKQIKNKYKISKDDFVLGNITRFDSNKNMKFVVEIFNEILKAIPNSILILGGTAGAELSSIQNQIETLNISENVRLIGPQTDVNVFLSIMDAYIFPSFTEGLGIAALESQAANVPVFLSDTIPAEVDIGLGLVCFISLSKNAKEWASIIINNYNKKELTYEEINRKFKETGYTGEYPILEKIYNNR